MSDSPSAPHAAAGSRLAPAVAGAVATLYETFAGYRPTAPVIACQHCAPGAEAATVFAHPAPSLGADDLEQWALKAGTTWGGADELRALLPRCLELAVAGTPRLPLRWVTAKLRHTGWLGWPPTEQQAVADVLVALWDDVLDGDTGYHDAGGAVLAVAEAIDDVGPFLATWHERCGGAGRERALRHLARFIVAYRGELTADVLPAQVQAWVRGPTTRIQLDRAIFDFGGTPLSEAAAAAIAVIDELGPVPT